MALARGDGGTRRRDRKRHWAYIQVGHKGVKYVHNMHGDLVPDPHQNVSNLPVVMRWVKVGSQLYRQMRAKGHTPVAVRTGRRPNPNSVPAQGSNSQNVRGTGGKGTGSSIGAAAGGGKNKSSGGNGGGGGGKRGKRGRGISSARASGQTQKAVAQMLGSTKAGKRLGKGYADALAGVQFDAPIHDIKSLIDRLGPQNAQAINDLSHWFGNVSQLNAQAGARSGQIANEVAGNQDQAVQGLMAALGGGANPANQNIAALEANDSGYQRVLGGIQQQYHANMDPILAGAEANAKEREQRLNLTQMQDYQLQLADLLGQRGQAKTTNQLEVDKYNNELAQQWFQNKLAKLNANLGAQAAGVDMQAKLAGIRQSQRQSRAAGNTAQNVWRKMNPAQRDELLQRATGAYQKADGTVGYSRTQKQAQAWLSGVLKNPVGSGKNKGLLTMLYQYYH